MYRIYRPAGSTSAYAIKLCTDGVQFFDSATGQHTFIPGDFETIHQALGIYLLRQLRVDDAWGELSRGIFDSF